MNACRLRSLLSRSKLFLKGWRRCDSSAILTRLKLVHLTIGDGQPKSSLNFRMVSWVSRSNWVIAGKSEGQDSAASSDTREIDACSAYLCSSLMSMRWSRGSCYDNRTVEAVVIATYEPTSISNFSRPSSRPLSTPGARFRS